MALPLHHAADAPHRVAVVDDAGLTLTYGDLDAFARRLCNLIRAAGVPVGGHVALCLENRAEYFGVTFGARYAGVYYTCISPWLHDDEVSYIVENCEAEIVIGSSATLSKLAGARAQAGRVRHWFTLDDATPGWLPLAPALVAQPTDLPEDPIEGRDMLYSSGTTGKPKGVLHPLAPSPFGEETEGSIKLFDRNGMGRDTVYLNPAPLYHAAPLRWSMSVLRRGGKVISMGRFDAPRALLLMTEHAVTHVQFVPTMMLRILKLPQAVRDAFDPQHLRSVIHAAAPCPVDAKREMIDWWGPVVVEYYGGTESNGLTYVLSEEWLARPGTVGRALMGRLHILDEQGDELPPGEAGKVYWSGMPPFQYHGEPEKTAGAYLGDKSTLGDIGYVDAEGYLFLTDRDVNLIVCGGINIYPQLTEDTLATHPQVGDAAVIGYPDDDLGEVLLAVVEPHESGVDPSALTRDLRAHCDKALPKIRRPRHYDVVASLPRHPNGKLRKVELRAAYRQIPRQRLR